VDSQPPCAPVSGRQASNDLPPAPTNAKLVASILRKDRKAAARFVAAHIGAVYAYARHRFAPRADLVGDVVQELVLAALNSLAAFQGQSSLRMWHELASAVHA
jgi:DNA-directed RNA polymerase specialized sigma24 family protein